MNSSVVVQFRVSPTPRSQQEQDDILDFYKRQTSTLQELGVKDIHVSAVEQKNKSPIFQVSFTILPDNVAGDAQLKETAVFLAESIVDPDEDGNHSLPNGELVSGRILEESSFHPSLR